MQSYSYESLNSLLGQKLTLTDDQGHQVMLVIDKVEKSKLDSMEWEAFSACLVGDASFHVPQGTYQLKHPGLGEEAFFLSPKSAVEYELVINRRKLESHC